MELESRIDLIIPKEVIQKIADLCRLISQVEWSGILLYKVEGTIKNPDTLRLIAKDIILMHKGNSTYTEYNFNEKKRDQSGYLDRHIDYTDENEEALEWTVGHIHSHNNMKVFFSGTDMEELNDNSPSHNFYLSLIVNNKLDLQAKVSFMATAEVSSEAQYLAIDDEGQPYTVMNTTLTAKKDKLFIYDCNIICDKTEVTTPSFFERNIADVLLESERKAFVPNKVTTPSYGKTYAEKNKAPGGYKNPTTSKNTYPKSFPSIQNQMQEEEEDLHSLIEDDMRTIPTDIERFAMLLINRSNEPEGVSGFGELCNKIYHENKIFGLSAAISEYLLAVYEKSFGEIGDSEDFISNMDLTIELFEIWELKWKFLTPCIKIMREILDKFVEMEESNG